MAVAVDAARQLHLLLILSDSALPIGSFAYSSGLESCVAHSPQTAIDEFLLHSVDSLCHTTVPLLRAAYATPQESSSLDDLFDANTPCEVARRASAAQGRALLKLLDRCLCPGKSSDELTVYKTAISQKKAFGHFGVCYGLVGKLLRVEIDQLVYTFVQSHVKAVLSAAVRLSLLGPYEMTELLASSTTHDLILDCISRTREILPDDICQTHPLLDIYQGRHALLYSRIFNA
ncbi:hypothetical protein PYCC9005_000923 [Savitreella phatthalungensis]